MDDFSAKPGPMNMYGLVGSEANAVAPDKRMLSSMSPTIVEDPQGRLLLVAGTPGGSTIITTVFQIVTNVVDYEMNVSEAIAARRVHHQWKPRPLRYELGALSADVREALRRRGWDLQQDGPWGVPPASACATRAPRAGAAISARSTRAAMGRRWGSNSALPRSTKTPRPLL